MYHVGGNGKENYQLSRSVSPRQNCTKAMYFKVSETIIPYCSGMSPIRLFAF